MERILSNFFHEVSITISPDKNIMKKGYYWSQSVCKKVNIAGLRLSSLQRRAGKVVLGWHLETWISGVFPSFLDKSDSLGLTVCTWFMSNVCFLFRNLKF